jgi:NADPH2:quinone reductase
VAVPARFVRPLSGPPDFVAGAAVAVTGLTADHALFTVGRVRAGERVAITAAAGGVGTMAVQMAVAAGARVLAVASTKAKCELARALGAQEAVGYQTYRQALDGGVDLVVDAVGGSLFRAGWNALKPDGRYVLYGFAAALGPARVRWLRAAWELLRMGVIAPSAIVQSTKTLAGFNLSLVPHLAGELRSRFDRIEKLLATGALSPVVGAVLPFERLPEAHALLQGRASTGKVVVQL